MKNKILLLISSVYLSSNLSSQTYNNLWIPDKAKSYISEAVDQILNHNLVLNPKTDSFGCKIFYRN